MWLLVFYEAYLIKTLFHRSPKEAPAATFFWKDYNFKITPIILGEKFFFQSGVFEVLSFFKKKKNSFVYKKEEISESVFLYILL